MIAPARIAAVDALGAIDEQPIDLGEAIARARQPLRDERDRALLLEIVTGTLRMRGAIDYQLAARSSRPIHKLDAAVLRVLRLSAFQILYQSRVPAPAIINDAVELTRRAAKSSAAGLVNAVLRKLSRERDQLTWPDDPAVVHSHPPHAIALTASDDRLVAVSHAATMFVPPDVPCFTQTSNLIVTAQLGGSLAQALGDHSAIFLLNHGIVTVGPDLETAVVRAVLLETACEHQLLTRRANRSLLHTDDDEALAKRATIWHDEAVRSMWSHLVRNLPRRPEAAR